MKIFDKKMADAITTEGTEALKKLVAFFETNEFNVHEFEQDGQKCAEIEKWTDGGVDMIITLMPFSSEKFIEYVNDFSVDEQVRFYQQDELYREHFTISKSLKDFRKFYNQLKKVTKSLKKELENFSNK